jgi:hypothetical protein
MSVKTAYLSRLGANHKISDNFTLKEMRCKDGSDKVLYSSELLEKLEELRAYGGFTITINSGYRTAAYNKKIGGASASQHTKGTAADIVVKKDGKAVDSRKVCCLCQTLGFKGIGYISTNAVHLDMRESGTYRGDERSGYGNNVTDFYRYFGVNMSQITALKAVTETNTITAKNTEKAEKEETVYKDINEVPEWGKEAVQRRIDAKATDGLNLTESMVRCWVVEDKMNPFYSKLEDVPAYWFESVKAMVAAGIIMGDGANQIGMTRTELKNAVIAWRIKKFA